MLRSENNLDCFRKASKCGVLRIWIRILLPICSFWGKGDFVLLCDTLVTGEEVCVKLEQPFADRDFETGDLLLSAVRPRVRYQGRFAV